MQDISLFVTIYLGLCALGVIFLAGTYLFFSWRISLRQLWRVYFPLPSEQPNHPLISRATRTQNTVAQATQGSINVLRRAVGYCKNEECESFNKGSFLLSQPETFYCTRCRKAGLAEPEEGSYVGDSDTFKEVRVEYNFDPAANKYQGMAIVRDESLWGRNNVYTLKSPLIQTDSRALKVAEAILANLNLYGLSGGGFPHGTREIILHLDNPREDFQAQCARLSQTLERSSLAQPR